MGDLIFGGSFGLEGDAFGLDVRAFPGESAISSQATRVVGVVLGDSRASGDNGRVSLLDIGENTPGDGDRLLLPRRMRIGRCRWKDGDAAP